MHYARSELDEDHYCLAGLAQGPGAGETGAIVQVTWPDSGRHREDEAMKSAVRDKQGSTGLTILLAAWLLGLAGMAQAVEWSGPTEAELALLPPYCEAKRNPGSPKRQYWHRSLGRIFQSIHHYCAALNFMNRYYRTPGPERKTLLKFALDDFNYMLKNPDPNSPLVPEIYVQRAIALKLAKQDSKALRDLNRALKLNPRYTKAYLELINYHTDKGQRSQALKVATRALRYLPEVGILRKRYDELGGKQPYPEPLVKAETQAPATKDNPGEAQPESAMPAGDEETMSDQKTAGEPAVRVPPEEFPREDRKNPWCRFCTE